MKNRTKNIKTRCYGYIDNFRVVTGQKQKVDFNDHCQK